MSKPCQLIPKVTAGQPHLSPMMCLMMKPRAMEAIMRWILFAPRLAKNRKTPRYAKAPNIPEARKAAIKEKGKARPFSLAI